MKIESEIGDDCIVLEPENELDHFLLGQISANPILSSGCGYNITRFDERIHVPFLKITKECFLKILTGGINGQ